MTKSESQAEQIQAAGTENLLSRMPAVMNRRLLLQSVAIAGGIDPECLNAKTILPDHAPAKARCSRMQPGKHVPTRRRQFPLAYLSRLDHNICGRRKSFMELGEV